MGVITPFGGKKHKKGSVSLSSNLLVFPKVESKFFHGNDLVNPD